MRLGLKVEGPHALARARDADAAGLWAVAVSGPPGTEAIRAARIAQQTRYARIVVTIDLDAEHPFTTAEEIAVLDNLSGGRAVAIVAGHPDEATLDHFRDALVGRSVGAAMLAPPPVQTEVPVWSCASLADDCTTVADSLAALAPRPGRVTPGTVALSGDLARDRRVVDAWRETGCTHLLVSWPGDVGVLARHLATRAATAAFPEVVAQLADTIAPLKPTRP